MILLGRMPSLWWLLSGQGAGAACPRYVRSHPVCEETRKAGATFHSVLNFCALIGTSGLPERVSLRVRDGLEQGLSFGTAHKDQTGGWAGAHCDQSL